MAHPLTFKPKRRRWYRFAIALQAVLYSVAGFNHFRHPETYLRIMPPWIPHPELVVFASGIAEIVLGILLLPGRSRKVAAWGIILLLIAVFPANIQMALDWHREAHPREWIAWVRLPLQIPLVLLALSLTRDPVTGRPTR